MTALAVSETESKWNRRTPEFVIEEMRGYRVQCFQLPPARPMADEYLE